MKPLNEMPLADVGRLTEVEARTILENLRWPNGPICPSCNTQNVARIAANRGKGVRPGLIQCRECRTQFTVTVGTIFEDSHITLDKWFLAFALMCSRKKGISALQLQRNLGLGSYRSAWFMAHRIRKAMEEGPLAELLKGTIEVDETYVGGKPRRGQKAKKGRPGPGSKKVPVVALVQRDGKVRSMKMERLTAKNLREAIKGNADPSARIMTDELPAYKGVGKDFPGNHHTVNHGRGEYARGDAHENSAESFFALLKRGVYGVFHHVSRQHLDRYATEFSFRWNHRKVTDGERIVAAILGSLDRRLVYVLAH